MYQMDAQTEARVWERVRGEGSAPPDAGAFPGLLLEELQAAAALQLLSRRFQGRERMLLQRMVREEQEHAACLRGICRLVNGSTPACRAPAAEDTSTEILLRRCYAGKMRALAAYESRCSGEYAPAFAAMAAQERQHACLLLQLMGK